MINKEYLYRSIIFGALALVIYCVSSKGLFSDIHVIRNAFAQLTFIPFVYWLQVITNRNIFSKRWIPEYIIWFVWTLVMPILFYMEYTVTQNFIRFKGETLFGNAILLGLILLRVMAFDSWKKWWGYIFYAFMYISVWLLPIFQFVYHCIYGEFISTSAIIALQQTDPKESIEWILTYVKISGIFILGISLVLLGGFVPAFEHLFKGICSSTSYVKHKKGIVILSLIVWGVAITKLLPMVGVIDQWKEQKILQNEEKRFNENYEERYESIVIKQNVDLPKGTFIVIVGESESKDYMHVYNPLCGYENTPWLSKMKNDGNMVIFNNAYACYNLTKIALGTGFTEASQYNDISFTESMSLIDIAKKAGYKTYWFSNQIGEQFNEVPIQMIANRANVVENSKNEYDDGLLPLLETVNPDEKNLIVIHLAGSHARYECRFPENERVFMDKEIKDDYANTVFFTDRLVGNITEYAKNNLNLQAILYYSDHGEDYELGHGPAVKKWSTVRIPMWIYVTDDYKRSFKEKTDVLRAHRNSFFTNDMVFNTVCGVMGILSNHYDYREDISSKDYSFTKESVFSFNRQLPISNDCGQEDFEYIDRTKTGVVLVGNGKNK